MKFAKPLITGKLIKRYKRFLADIVLDTGEEVTAHCANSGALLGLTIPGSKVWLSESDNPSRKLKYTWELVESEGTMVGINTSHPNILVSEAIQSQELEQLKGYTELKREVKYGVNSRIDIFLSEPQRPNCYVEVKITHLKRNHFAEFPDAVTSRGKKHLEELSKMIEQGNRAVMIYVIQRDDCNEFCLAKDIDPAYAKAAEIAFASGVEAYAFACKVEPTEIKLHRQVPIHL